MRETLYIRLRATDPDALTSYCIARSDAMASFVVEHAPLRDLFAQCAGRRTVLLVPSTDVRLAGIQLPARQVAKVLQAVPFALEEQLAEDIDTMHFALGARQADGAWPVAAVARGSMDRWLGCFAEHGVRPDAIIPDVLALPVPAADRLSLLIDGEQVLVRSGVASGFACHRDDIELCLQMIDPEQTRGLRTMIPRDQDFDPSTLRWSQEALHGFAHPLEAMLQGLAAHPNIDLLQGDYSPQQDLLRLWRPWRLAAALALAAVVLGAAVHGIQSFRIGQELDALRARNQQRYQEIFPTETRIVDLEAQLQQQLAVNGGASAAALLPLMNVVADATGAVAGLSVQTVQFRDAALYVGLSAGNLQALEQLKTWFETSGAARLEVQAANSGSEGVQIRIKLTPA